PRSGGEKITDEGDGGVKLVEFLATADDLGYHHLTCSEHVAVPAPIAAERGATYFDPVATLSFLASATRRVRLATNVVVIGYHHPLALAKTYGTLDLLSGGRVVLGIGVGSLEEEFDLLGAEFAGRGEIADEAITALRAAWGRAVPHHEGPRFTFTDFVVEPHAPRTTVPMWIGGRTRRSLRRAVTYGTGWAPFGLGPRELTRIWESVERPDGFDLVLQIPPLDPLGDPDGSRAHLRTADTVGATAVNASLVATSAAHHLEQMAALRELAPERFETNPA
ncbi:TIGR03619 family F420-dependent LLM class oxidoreductase, partial [Micromonospora chalcea]